MPEQVPFGALRGGRSVRRAGLSSRGMSAPSLSSSVSQLRGRGRTRARGPGYPQFPGQGGPGLGASSGWENLGSGYAPPEWAEPPGYAPIPDLDVDELAERISDQVVAEGFAGLDDDLEDFSLALSELDLEAPSEARYGDVTSPPPVIRFSEDRIRAVREPAALKTTAEVDREIDLLLEQGALDDARRVKFEQLLRRRDMLLAQGMRPSFGAFIPDDLPVMVGPAQMIDYPAEPKSKPTLVKLHTGRLLRCCEHLGLASRAMDLRQMRQDVEYARMSLSDSVADSRLKPEVDRRLALGPVARYGAESYGEDAAKPSEPLGFWRSAAIGAGLGVGFLGFGLAVHGLAKLAK